MHVADQGELTRSILEASRLPRGTPWNYRETVKEQLPTPSGGMVSECHFPKLKSGLWIHPKKEGRVPDNDIFGPGGHSCPR